MGPRKRLKKKSVCSVFFLKIGNSVLWVGCARLKLSNSCWATPAEKELLLPRMQE